jgi:hypothetical protein
MRDGLYGSFAYGWIATGVLLFVLGLLGFIASGSRAASRMIAIGLGLVAFLNVASMVMVRDGIRDYTLRAAGFEVWDRVVVTNWSTAGGMLVLFVAAPGLIIYLGSALTKARRVDETYA